LDHSDESEARQTVVQVVHDKGAESRDRVTDRERIVHRIVVAKEGAVLGRIRPTEFHENKVESIEAFASS
jgi:hypothetical protein